MMSREEKAHAETRPMTPTCPLAAAAAAEHRRHLCQGRRQHPAVAASGNQPRSASCHVAAVSFDERYN